MSFLPLLFLRLPFNQPSKSHRNDTAHDLHAPQNACIHAPTHHPGPSPLPKKSTNCQRTLQRRTKEPVQHSKHQHTTPAQNLDTPCRFQIRRTYQGAIKEGRVWERKKGRHSVDNQLLAFFLLFFSFSCCILLCFSVPYP